MSRKLTVRIYDGGDGLHHWAVPMHLSEYARDELPREALQVHGGFRSSADALAHATQVLGDRISFVEYEGEPLEESPVPAPRGPYSTWMQRLGCRLMGHVDVSRAMRGVRSHCARCGRRSGFAAKDAPEYVRP